MAWRGDSSLSFVLPVLGDAFIQALGIIDSTHLGVLSCWQTVCGSDAWAEDSRISSRVVPWSHEGTISLS